MTFQKSVLKESNSVPNNLHNYIGWFLPEGHHAITKLMSYVGIKNSADKTLSVITEPGAHNEPLYKFFWKKI